MGLEQLGPYRIGKRIGKGGMGSVYAAIHEQTENQAAIKVLAPQLASEEGFRERFEAEIDSLKILQHEGIVRLFGYGEQDGLLFYSMELVEGTSLEEELRSGRRFDWREVLQIGIQICHALKHAHDHGVVHRDIKPANLLMAADHHVKIADFGIARLFGGTQLTTAGGVLGTADYMSPEQADGSTTTERCDQYSLGGVMYALLAGRPPFLAKTMPEMLQLQRFAKPELVRRYAPETPEPLERLLSQLLAKEPEDRFPNVMVLGRHMEAMEKALSRPPKFGAEGGEGDTLFDSQRTIAAEGISDYSDDPTLAIDAYDTDITNLELEDASTGAISGSPSDVFNAPTLAEQASGASGASGASETSKPEVASKPTGSRFTTIDEETRRQRDLAAGSPWSLVLQLAGLMLALGCLAWVGWRLMRPASADALYEEITTTIDEEGTENLRRVAEPLEEFLDRFADDPRAEQLKQYEEELVWQRRERAWRMKSNLTSRGEMSLSESIYSEAMRLSKQNPARAVAMLESLVALFESDAAKEADRHWVALASRQLIKLRATVEEQTAAHLPELRERLAAAAKLEKTSPEAARRMYRAIVSLYDSHPWADGAVEEARRRLANNAL